MEEGNSAVLGKREQKVWGREWPPYIIYLCEIVKEQMNRCKKSKVKSIMTFGFKTYCIATVTKTVWYWHKNKTQAEEIVQETKRQIHEPTLQVLTKIPNRHWGKNNLINMLCLGNWISTQGILKLDTYHSVSIKINPKQIQGRKTWSSETILGKRETGRCW